MTREQYANNAVSTLSASMDNSTTTLPLTAATLFPASPQYRVIVDAEIMLVTAGAGTTSQTVTRAVEGTSAASHAQGSIVTHIVTAASLGLVGARATGVYGPTNGNPFIAITSQGQDVGTNAAFQLVYGGAMFNSRFNPIQYFGYNVADGGAKVLAGEPELHFAIEGDYDNGSGRFLEAYLNYTSDDGGTGIRPWMVAINRVTDAVTWSFVATTSSFLLPTGEQLLYIDTGSILMAARTGVSNVFQIKAAAGQGATIILGANASDTAFQLGTATSGTEVAFTVTGRRILTLYSTPLGGAGAVISVGGVAENTAVGLFAVNTSPAATMGLVTRGRGGQTGSLFEAQDTSSVMLSRFNKDGYFGTSKIAAPANGDVNTSELMLWFDNTNGAGKLMVKAKTANGTVVTGSLALA